MGIEPTWDSPHCPTPDLKSDRTGTLTAGYSFFFSVIKESYLIRDCTSGYLGMTLKYLPEEAVYSLCTPSGRLKIRSL
jgi:hypothetical protein